MARTRLVARAEEVVAGAVMRRDAVAVGPFRSAGDLARLMNVPRRAAARLSTSFD